MESKLIASLAFVLIFCCAACNKKNKDTTSIPYVPTELEYELVWSDEFDYEGKPDSLKWTYENGFVRNEELQWYQPNNANCENGLLVIEGRKENIPNPNYNSDSDNWKENRPKATFSSASVTTRGLHTWTYGRFEVKAKIITQEGLWPAIWTIGASQPWPEGGEIDIMEYYGGDILANAAWSGPNQWQAIWDDSKTPVSSFGDANWDEKFHIWRMDWTNNSIKIYLDEQLLNTIELSKTINQRGSVENPFKIPHFLILNLAIGGKAGGDPTGTSFPSRYEIDYVRIYQLK